MVEGEDSETTVMVMVTVVVVVGMVMMVRRRRHCPLRDLLSFPGGDGRGLWMRRWVERRDETIRDETRWYPLLLVSLEFEVFR